MEISGSSANDPDLVTGSAAITGPDYSLQINGYTVLGDIDFLYRVPKAGNARVNLGRGMKGPVAGLRRTESICCIKSIAWRRPRRGDGRRNRKSRGVHLRLYPKRPMSRKSEMQTKVFGALSQRRRKSMGEKEE